MESLQEFDKFKSVLIQILVQNYYKIEYPELKFYPELFQDVCAFKKTIEDARSIQEIQKKQKKNIIIISEIVSELLLTIEVKHSLLKYIDSKVLFQIIDKSFGNAKIHLVIIPSRTNDEDIDKYISLIQEMKITKEETIHKYSDSEIYHYLSMFRSEKTSKNYTLLEIIDTLEHMLKNNVDLKGRASAAEDIDENRKHIVENFRNLEFVVIPINELFSKYNSNNIKEIFEDTLI